MKVFILILLSLCLLLAIAPNPILGDGMTVNLVTLDWPPYIGHQLEEGGYLAVIVREAFQRVGYEVTIDFLPWSRAYSLTKRGDYDGLIATYYTQERGEYFYYHGEPLGETEIVFMELVGSDIQYEKMEDLLGYSIGINRGFAYPEVFEAADFLVKFEADDSLALLKLLLGRRIHLILEDRRVLYYLLEEELGEERGVVNVVEPPLEYKKMYLAFTHHLKDKGMVEAFNRGLLDIKEDGTFQQIIKGYGL